MTHSNISYHFSGLKPKDPLTVLAKELGERLLSQAPSDASLRFALNKMGSVYNASCEIVAYTGVFSASENGQSSYELLRRLEKKLLFQLNHWRTYRLKLLEDKNHSDLEWISYP